MRRLFWLAVMLAAVTTQEARAQAETKTPYADQQTRQIKALSDDEVEGYLQGRGMGFAKAAELNRHPGPLHVLELAAQLNLSAAQKDATQKIFERMRAEARRLGRLIVEREAGLDRLFAAGRVDERSLRAAVSETARLQGALRVAHLRAHLEVKKLLSPAQVRKYDELRGYGAGAPPPPHDPRRHGKH